MTELISNKKFKIQAQDVIINRDLAEIYEVEINEVLLKIDILLKGENEENRRLIDLDLKAGQLFLNELTSLIKKGNFKFILDMDYVKGKRSINPVF